MIIPRGMGIAAAVLLAGFGISSAPAQDTGGLPGLHEEIAIKLAKDPVKGNFSLNLSAIPFAGPMYFDNVPVTDLQGNELWEYPEFEAEQ
jgi:hypothetical protein